MINVCVVFFLLKNFEEIIEISFFINHLVKILFSHFFQNYFY
jgi:hypothetical protein